MVGARLRLLGELRGPSGAAELREAVDVLTGSVARLELARACSALARTGPADAVPLLRQALDIATDCGAEGLRADAAAALTAAGVDDARSPGGLARLASGERRIASLYAEGRDVREIAQELLVPPQVVRTTLEEVRRRLDVPSAEALRVLLSAG